MCLFHQLNWIFVWYWSISTCLDYRNYATDRDSRGTIIAGSSGQRYIDNVFYNPDNDYEMIALNWTGYFEKFIQDLSLVLFCMIFCYFSFIYHSLILHYPGTYPATLLGRRGNLLSSSLSLECIFRFCLCWLHVEYRTLYYWMLKHSSFSGGFENSKINFYFLF